MSVAALEWAKRQKLGAAGRKSVLIALAHFADDSGVCWPSNRALQRATELSERAIRYAMADLVRLGLLRREARCRDDGSRTSDRLFLALPGVGQQAPGVGQPLPGDGALVAPLTTFEQSSEPIRVASAPKRVRSQAAKPSSTQTDTLFETFWKAFPHRPKDPRLPARRAFDKAVAQFGAEAVIAGATCFARTYTGDRQFIPQATTWLNQQRWRDEVDVPALRQATPADTDDCWRRRVANWLSTANWASSWGPAPNEPDTLVPAHVCQSSVAVREIQHDGCAELPSNCGARSVAAVSKYD